MFIKRILPIAIIVLSSVLGFFCWRENSCVDATDQTYQSGWSGENPFSIKIERKPKRCRVVFKAMAGANYIFQVKQGNAENWREIMSFEYDDPIDISKENIHLLNENVAYIFFGRRFAVTTDNGRNWKIWDAKKDLPNWECCTYDFIKSVNLLEDGSGTMTLKPDSNKRGEISELKTKDFGKTWTP